jgi:LPS export ABC transporter protein LptC
MYILIKRHWPLLGIGLLVVVVAWKFLWIPKEVSPKPVTAYGGGSEESAKMEDIHFTQENPDEKVKWTLDAKEVTLSKDRRYTRFQGFRLKLVPERRAALELEGKSGSYDRDSGVITLDGDLKGDTSDGYHILTEKILYKSKEGTLESPGDVKIRGPFFSIEGRGLFLDLEKETLRIDFPIATLSANELLTL